LRLWFSFRCWFTIYFFAMNRFFRKYCWFRMI